MRVAVFDKLRQNKWLPLALAVALVFLTLASRVAVSYFLATDEPGDGAVYSQIARNILEQKVYSIEAEAPFTPTLIRLPGYPLFLAAVYSIFGHDNNTAVRVVQAFVDTATCIIAALIAFLWTDKKRRRAKNAFWTFMLTALCPFVVIYTATLLTETLSTFLMALMTLTVTLAFKSASFVKSILWWTATGLIAGAATMIRPDAGLFAFGIGLMIVIDGLFLRDSSVRKNARSERLDTQSKTHIIHTFFRIFANRLKGVVLRGAVFSLVFILFLAPWTIRNYRLFGVFQPLSPAHAEMPGEFVPHGYDKWLRTWIDDSRFTEPMLWNLNEKPIRVEKIPARVFDSPEERARVAALLDAYNNPPGSENQSDSAKSGDADSDDDANSDDDSSDDAASSDDDKNSNDAANADSSGDNANDDASGDAREDSDDDQLDDDEDKHSVVLMTPEIDAGFAEIAEERIERAPARYYLFLPAKRAAALWFDSHSLYYPFGGQISPVSDLDADEHQQYWLPAFTLLTWIYTLLALGGAFFLWRNRANKNILRWLILLALMTLPRVVFLSSIENPEPRYVVELFVFACIAGGIFLGRFTFGKSKAETISVLQPSANRLLSLDVFRGLTIAAMVLVNTPGTWDAVYAPLLHADWNGATPTDFIFPFFLFIVGVSIAFALRASSGSAAHLKIFRRASLLFALGLFLEIFPFYNLWTGAWVEPSGVRIMGVLQRIAICYLISALIFLHADWRRQMIVCLSLLLVYWALMTLIDVPGCGAANINDKFCNLAAYFDRTILTENHIWRESKIFDPEGILSTLPAIATTLFGVLCGQWLKTERRDDEKASGLFFSGIVLTALGWTWSFWFPLNKSLWTSSFAVYTAGLALLFFAACFWLVDIKGYKKWAKPFLIFGANAVALFVASSILGACLDLFEIETTDGRDTLTLQELIFKRFFLPHFAAPAAASLAYAAAFLLLWLILMWLLYRKRIFIKI